jgi:hypothetical protein
MVSAIDCTWLELTGSGNVATAALIAVSMMLIVSGEKDALEKSFMGLRPEPLPATRKTVAGSQGCRTKLTLNYQ